MGQGARQADGYRRRVRLSVPRVLTLLAGLAMLVVACTSSPSTPTPTATASVPGPSPNGDSRRVTVLASADPPHLDVHQDVSSVLASEKGR